MTIKWPVGERERGAAVDSVTSTTCRLTDKECNFFFFFFFFFQNAYHIVYLSANRTLNKEKKIALTTQTYLTSGNGERVLEGRCNAMQMGALSAR